MSFFSTCRRLFSSDYGSYPATAPNRSVSARAMFDSLEGRTLFSASSFAAALAPAASQHSAIIQPLAAAVIPSMVGNWSGAIAIKGVHTQGVTLAISSQSSTGAQAGNLKATANPTINVAYTGQISAKGAATITLAGGHSGGAINGTGNGKLSKDGKTIKFKMTFVQGGHKYAGTLTLKRV